MASENMLEEKIKEVIEKKINPVLTKDGGKAEFVGIEDEKVTIRLKGHCAGCPMKQYTITNFVKTILMQSIPEVKDVIEVV